MSKTGFSKTIQIFCQRLLWGSLGLLFVWPSVVLSQVLQVPLTLSRQPDEAFDSFVERAAALTTATVKKRFETDKGLNQVRVVVVGENNGQVAPLLEVTMSRAQWFSSKDSHPYINFLPDSEALLDFQTPQPSPDPGKSAAPDSGATSAPPTTYPPTTPPNPTQTESPPSSPTAQPTPKTESPPSSPAAQPTPKNGSLSPLDPSSEFFRGLTTPPPSP